MNDLGNLLNRIETKIPFCESSNESISKSTVGWHIEHTLLTINKVIGAISKSDPKEYHWKFSFSRLLIMTLKKLPRGKVKAPDVVQPKENFNDETLLTHLSKTREKIKALETMNKDNYFEHPYFGHLKTKPTIIFLEIHTTHHLKIIDDILK